MSRALFLALGLLASIFTQAQDSCKHKTYPQVNPLLIQQFQAARCLETTTWQVDSSQINRVHIALEESQSAKTKSPFLLLFSTSQTWDQGQPLYLISKGLFKASHLSIPLHWQGHYFLAILDHQNPALISVDGSGPLPKIEYRKTCSLHY
ncbi:MAG: hypothetical protein HRU41_41675 [Saprospiraceae bacterium]|nr:hypothetical protein [Saprospiraceae bacterium]